MEQSFTTKVTILPLQEPLGYNHNWLTLGSCFSEHIGDRLKQSGFSICQNPFGVLFNPRSISLSIRKLMSGELIKHAELFQTGSIWNHFSFSNLYSGVDTDEVINTMNQQLQQAKSHLQSTSVLMLTFGTAWIYEEKESGRVVANCHKLPAQRFNRRRLTVSEIVDDFTDLINQLPAGIKIVFTVSPVRHWKDGAYENTLSKSILHLAIDELTTLFSNSVYFPAYELVVDELRDYRFYTEDMVHPTPQAAHYIWKKFSDWCFSSDTKEVIKKTEHYHLLKNHRPIHPGSMEYFQFLQKTEDEKISLLKEYPFLTNRI